MDNLGTDNTISVGENVTLTGSIKGNHNVVVIEDAVAATAFHILISGDFNTVRIGAASIARKLTIRCGNHVPAHNTALTIGAGTTFEGGCVILLPTSGNQVAIGADCMISNEVTLRTGESPHLLFDIETGRYLDGPNSLTIGDHVWVGEKVYITKNAAIPDDCIVAACSVVTRKFAEPSCVLGGNPAAVVREGVEWVRNRGQLVENTTYASAYREHHSQYPIKPE